MTQAHPDINWVRRAVLSGLLTHPYVKSACVNRIDRAGREVPVNIVRGRLFGGPELIESGLTLAVYPYHSEYDVIVGVHSQDVSNKSVVYPQTNGKGESYNTLGGRRGVRDRGYYSCIKLVVQLYYRDANYNTPDSLDVKSLSQDWVFVDNPRGLEFKYLDKNHLDQDSVLENSFASKPTEDTTVQIQVLPGEEILTRWMDILKFAIRDLSVFQPYSDLRNPQVLLTDFPSSTWSAKNANLVFHTAYHLIKFDLIETNPYGTNKFPPVREIDISTGPFS